MFISNIVLTFNFYVIFSDFDIRVMLASYNEFRSIYSSATFSNHLRKIAVNIFINVW